MVVISGENICNYQYSFAWNLSLYGSLLYLITFFCCQGFKNPFIALYPDHKEQVTKDLHKQAFINGLLWCMNYVFLLLANPKTPSLYQVVFNELNLVVVFVASLIFQGNTYTFFQILALITLLVGGLIPLADSSSEGASAVGWYLMYVLGAWSIGIANTVTENVMRNIYLKRGSKKQFLVSISQFLFLTNFYSIFQVLALLWVPYLAYGEDKWKDYWLHGMKCLWTGICDASDNAECAHQNNRDGIMYTWLSSTLSFICAFVAALMQRDYDVVYVTVAYAVAPVLSTVIFVGKKFMGDYYDAPTDIAIVATIVTLFAGLGYKVITWVTESRRKSGNDSWTIKTHQQLCSVTRWKFQPYEAENQIQDPLIEDNENEVANPCL